MVSVKERSAGMGECSIPERTDDTADKGVNDGIVALVALDLRRHNPLLLEDRQVLGNNRLGLIEQFPQLGHAGILLFDETEELEPYGMTTDLEFFRIGIYHSVGTAGIIFHSDFNLHGLPEFCKRILKKIYILV
jgi:hypothetical protein